MFSSSTMTRTTAIGAAAVLAMSVAACSSSKAKTTSTSHTTLPTTSTSGAPATDYTKLLIAASDIPVPGFSRVSAVAPPNVPGAAGVYTDASGRHLGDTIVVVSDGGAAATAAQAGVTAAKSSLTSVTTSASTVGSNAQVISGKSSDGSKAETILVFTEGRAYVVMEFDSAAADPVPADVVNQVGAKQDALIKNGLSA